MADRKPWKTAKQSEEAVLRYEVLDPVEAMKQEVEEPAVYDQEAFSVIRLDDMYKLVKIPFNKNDLRSGQPEVVFQSTDRWEVQSQFDFYSDQSFLLIEEIQK